MLPDKLERSVRTMVEAQVDFSYCVIEFRDRELRPIPGSFGAAFHGDDVDWLRYLWCSNGPVYRRELIWAVGPWLESVFFADDWEYSARVKLLGWRGCFDPTVGGMIRVYPRKERAGFDQRRAEALDQLQASRCVAGLAAELGRQSPEARRRLARRFVVGGLGAAACGEFAHQREALAEARALVPASRVILWLSLASQVVRSASAWRAVLWLVRHARLAPR